MEKLKRHNGEAIQYMRIKSGMTVSDLAGKALVSYPHLDNIEKERKEASLEVLHRIANALNVPVTALVRDPNSLKKAAPAA